MVKRRRDEEFLMDRIETVFPIAIRRKLARERRRERAKLFRENNPWRYDGREH